MSATEQARHYGEQIATHQHQIMILSQKRKGAVEEMAETMTYREIAAELGISEPAVSHILGRGWKRAR